MNFFPEQIELEAIFRDVIEMFLIPKFLELDMRATSEWEANLTAIVDINGDAATATIRGRDYTEQLVHGLPPGNMPNPNDLIPWVNAKLGIFGDEAVSVSWAIAKSIEAKGTTWFQKGGSDLLEVLESTEVMQFIQDRLASLMTSRVELFFVRELKKME